MEKINNLTKEKLKYLTKMCKKMLILMIAIYVLHTLIMKDRKIVKSADKRCELQRSK